MPPSSVKVGLFGAGGLFVVVVALSLLKKRVQSVLKIFTLVLSNAGLPVQTGRAGEPTRLRVDPRVTQNVLSFQPDVPGYLVNLVVVFMHLVPLVKLWSFAVEPFQVVIVGAFGISQGVMLSHEIPIDLDSRH